MVSSQDTSRSIESRTQRAYLSGSEGCRKYNCRWVYYRRIMQVVLLNNVACRSVDLDPGGVAKTVSHRSRTSQPRSAAHHGGKVRTRTGRRALSRRNQLASPTLRPHDLRELLERDERGVSPSAEGAAEEVDEESVVDLG